MTGTVLVALGEAREAGVEMSDSMVRRAVRALREQRKPDFSYVYQYWMRFSPWTTVNRKQGALGRSHACNIGGRFGGDESIPDAALRAWLDRLFARQGWLSMARKTNWPHAGYFGIAGYYYYYAMYYAMRSMEALPQDEWPFYQMQMAHVLISLQEKDGSWWDYPLYNYHQTYGTAFALMSLERCLRKELSEQIAIKAKIGRIMAAAPRPLAN